MEKRCTEGSEGKGNLGDESSGEDIGEIGGLEEEREMSIFAFLSSFIAGSECDDVRVGMRRRSVL